MYYTLPGKEARTAKVGSCVSLSILSMNDDKSQIWPIYQMNMSIKQNLNVYMSSIKSAHSFNRLLQYANLDQLENVQLRWPIKAILKILQKR